MPKIMLKDDKERIESVFLQYPEGILVRIYGKDWQEVGAWNCVIPAKGFEEIDLALEQIKKFLRNYAAKE